MRGARALGNNLIVITHTDETMVKKKGYVFLPLAERLEILRELRCVTEVYVAEELGDTDGTVAKSLEVLRPHVFAKGGDRDGPQNMPKNELEVCDRLGIRVVYEVGEKVNSSSALVKKAAQTLWSLWWPP